MIAISANIVEMLRITIINLLSFLMTEFVTGLSDWDSKVVILIQLQQIM